MTIDEIEEQIEELDKKLLEVATEYNNLKSKKKYYRQQRNELKFNKVCDFINIGDVITFNAWISSKIQSGDVVKIVRKNKVSITIEYVQKTNSWGSYKVGDTTRVPLKMISRAIYDYSDRTAALKRDSALSELLG